MKRQIPNLETLRSFVEDVALKAAWFPTMVLVLHILLARVVLAYYYWPPLDIVTHCAGGIAIAYFFARTLDLLVEHKLEPPLTWTIRVVLVLALTGTTTVLWEFAEFLMDTFLGTHLLAGLNDTLMDMMMGMIGGVLLCASKYCLFPTVETNP